MKKIHNIYIGGKDDLKDTDESWAFVHSCKSSHQERLGYTRADKNSPHYILFEEHKHLYINWVDEPTGQYFKTNTFLYALDFIDKYIKTRKVLVHCDMGSSRGPTLGFVYLAKRTNFFQKNDFSSALKQFYKFYPYYTPSGILLFVKEHWNEIQ